MTHPLGSSGARCTGREPGRHPGVSREHFDAVLFDLDGVLTDTAEVHARCWKEAFDELLRRRARQRGEAWQPFDPVDDYLRFVDGKPRLEGARDFLAARGVRLDEADPDSPETIAERKDALFARALERDGVRAYPGSLRWLEQLRSQGFRTAVVSASHHCSAVLRAAGIQSLFDTRVDGGTADELQLRGKPAPDTFLEAARRLGVPAPRAVVVEDAIAGVEAGRAGGFGLVIGVARHAAPEALRAAGADRVVADLAELLG